MSANKSVIETVEKPALLIICGAIKSSSTRVQNVCLPWVGMRDIFLIDYRLTLEGRSCKHLSYNYIIIYMYILYYYNYNNETLVKREPQAQKQSLASCTENNNENHKAQSHLVSQAANNLHHTHNHYDH